MSKQVEAPENAEDESSFELSTIILTIKGIKLEKADVVRFLAKFYPTDYQKHNKDAYTTDYYWTAGISEYELIVCNEQAILSLNSFVYDLGDEDLKQELFILDEVTQGEIQRFLAFSKENGLNPQKYGEYQIYAQYKSYGGGDEPYDYEGSDD